MPELTRPLRPPTRRRWRIRRPLPHWGLAVLLAATTAGLVAHVAGGAAEAASRWSPGPAVLVVRAPVPAGEAVTTAHVGLRRLPAVAVPDGALRELPEGATAAVALHPGEVLLADRVRGASPVAARLPPGARGVAVPNDTALPVRVGDRVDVLATFEIEATGAPPTVAVARSALVVHVASDAVTVAVQEAAAPKVAYAVAAGAVTLALSGTSSRR